MFHRVRRWLPARFVPDARGSIAIISAVFLTVAMVATALAVDVASLYTERRALQGTTDLAAMAGASDIERAEAAVEATLKANGILAKFSVERGQYTPDERIAPSERFKPGRTPYNAVRVNAVKPGRLYFARAFTDRDFDVGVTATAANASLATYSVGSRLLAVRDGVINKLLGGLTGSQISLSLMDYESLIKSDVQLLQFMDALATQLDITGGTYSDVLDASATIGDVIAAAAVVTDRNSDAAATAALKSLLGQGDLTKTVPLSHLIDLGPLAALRVGDPAPGLDASFSAMELVSAAAVLANGSRQVQIDLGTSVPGLLNLKLELAIGEPQQHSAWAAVGQAGSVVRTAQTRLKLIAEVGGTGALAAARVRLPLYLDLAYGEGRLASVTCSNEGAPTATVAARSGIADVWIGEVTTSSFADFLIKPAVAKASIVDTSLIKVRGRAHMDIGSTSETMLTFDADDVANKVIKRTDTSSFAEAIVTSLLKDLQLDVQVLGLGLALPGAITVAVADTLAPIAKPLDEVVHTLLTTLGVHLGEADVRVHGMRCGSGVLAG